MNEKILALAKIINESKRIVFFGGAGVSTESGIPDFRSPSGLYNVKMKVPSLTNTSYSAEEILSHHFFIAHPDLFNDYYFNALIYPDARPNEAHKFLAELEGMGKLSCVVTQNIDGLHQAAGSKKVFELHGSIKRNYCMKCGAFYDEFALMEHKSICPKCGGRIKPDVVLYEEPLNEETITGSVEAIMQADCLIIGGTSLTVYPAAGFVRYFRGKYLVIINKDHTDMDRYASLAINEKIGEVFKEVRPLIK